MIHSITTQDVIISILWPTISVHHKVFLPRVHRSNTWYPSMAPTMLLYRWLVQGPVSIAHVVLIDFLKVVGYIQGAMFLSSPPSPYLNSTPRIQMKLILGCNRMMDTTCHYDPWSSLYALLICPILHRPILHRPVNSYISASRSYCSASNARRFFNSIDADTVTHDSMLLDSIAMIYLWTTVNIQNYDSLSSLSSLLSPWRWRDW